MIRSQTGCFGEIHEGRQVAALSVVVALVGDPHLYAGDVDASTHVWQPRGELIVVIAEILRQKVVAVGIILIGIERECRSLHSAAGVDRTGFGILLRHESRGCQPAELQRRLDAEQSRGA